MLPFPLELARHGIKRPQSPPKRLRIIIRKISGTIVVVSVMLRELEMPFQLARLWIESKQRVAVEIVARSAFAAIRRRRIPRRPERRVRRGIVGPRDPRWRAADFPRFSLPAFMPGLSRTGNRIEPPFARARRSIIGVDESADAVFAAGYSHEHEVLNHQRGQREAVAFGMFRRSRVPNNISRLAVQRDDMRVQRRHKNPIAEDRNTAVNSSATWADIRRQRLLVLPNAASGTRI